jgi:tagaturonate reductase
VTQRRAATDLPERVLMFGTGMLLRALVAAAVDDANRTGAFRGGIVAVESTGSGRAELLNQQHGVFTLVERGLRDGAPFESTRLIGSITRGIAAASDWPAIRELVARPELQVIVSNVTEVGLSLDDRDAGRRDRNVAPAGYPAKLTELLHARFHSKAFSSPLLVIPTELIPDNGPRLSALVGEVAARRALGNDFSDWIAGNVRFCSSLVDRITTGNPATLVSVTEPHALWAVEGNPDALRASFPIDDGRRVVFAPDITSWRERKLRLLNGAHTALAPVALLAGVPTVRAATEHPGLGAFFRRVLFDELVPGSGLPEDGAESYARAVWERFCNPWLDHAWSVIVANQGEKMRIRVVPSIVGFCQRRNEVPQGLALALAAHLRFLNMNLGELGNEALWGARLDAIPGLAGATGRWLNVIENDGIKHALATVFA